MRQGLSKDDAWGAILKNTIDSKGSEVYLFNDFVNLLVAATNPARPYIFLIHRLNNILPSIQRQRISRKFSTFDKEDVIKSDLVDLNLTVDIQRLKASKDLVFKLAIEEFLVDSQILLTTPELKPKVSNHYINWNLMEIKACFLDSNFVSPVTSHNFLLKNCLGSYEFNSNPDISANIGSVTTIGRTNLIEIDIGSGIFKFYEYFHKMKSIDNERCSIDLLLAENLKKPIPISSPVGKITFTGHLDNLKKESSILARETIFRASLVFSDVSKKFRNDNNLVIDLGGRFVDLYTQTVIEKVSIRLKGSDILDCSNFALLMLEFNNLQFSFSKNIFMNDF